MRPCIVSPAHVRGTSLRGEPNADAARSRRILTTRMAEDLTRTRWATAGGKARGCGLRVEFHEKSGTKAASRSLHRMVRPVRRHIWEARNESIGPGGKWGMWLDQKESVCDSGDT